jgi:hypothetical protein
MRIGDEEIDLSGPPINPGIRTLWDIDTAYAHHPRACSIYSHWMAGYDEPQITIFFNASAEEIRADLEHIKALLPEEMRAPMSGNGMSLSLQRRGSGRSAKNWLPIYHSR